MHATHCLVGCVLCLVSMSVVATTSAESQEMGGSAHAVLGNTTHSNSGTTGDPSEGSGSSDQSSSNGDPGSPISNSNDPGSAGPAPLHHAHAHHVGWQSLLPGSIQ